MGRVHVIRWKMNDVIDGESYEHNKGKRFRNTQLLTIKMHQGHNSCDHHDYAEYGDDAHNDISRRIK